MDWLTKILTVAGSVAKAVGGVVDAAVPVGTGSRTSVSALVVAAAPYIKAVVPAQYQPVVDLVSSVATTLLPLFAAAHVVR